MKTSQIFPSFEYLKKQFHVRIKNFLKTEYLDTKHVLTHLLVGLNSNIYLILASSGGCDRCGCFRRHFFVLTFFGFFDEDKFGDSVEVRIVEY